MVKNADRVSRVGQWVGFAFMMSIACGIMKTSASSEVDAVLRNCEAQLAPAIEEARQAVPAEQMQYYVSDKVSDIDRATAKRLQGMGPAVIPDLINYICNADPSKLVSRWCAVACADALSSFGAASIKPALAALEQHPDRHECFMTVLNAHLRESFIAAGEAVKTSRNKSFYAAVLSDLLKEAGGQYWANGVSNLVQQVQKEYGPNVMIEPIVYSNRASRLIPTDFLRLPPESSAPLLERTEYSDRRHRSQCNH